MARKTCCSGKIRCSLLAGVYGTCPGNPAPAVNSNTPRLIRQGESNVFYLNSMFSVPFTIYPLLLHWLGWIGGRMVLAPRGMLKPSALQFKPAKKKLFLLLFRLLGWHKGLVFHASRWLKSIQTFWKQYCIYFKKMCGDLETDYQYFLSHNVR